MTSNEIKQAMLNGTPVVCDGVQYQRITAYVYRAFKDSHSGKISCRLQCEVLDRSGRSVSVVDAERVEYIK